MVVGVVMDEHSFEESVLLLKKDGVGDASESVGVG